jgi:hypothetical protein
MPEPVTLTAAAIGAVALTEGIKFLYGQAGELLKRWRERKEQTGPEFGSASSWPVTVEIPQVFSGNRFDTVVHLQAVEEVSNQLMGLRRDLSEYATETIAVNPDDAALVGRVDALRTVLEAIYNKRLTFKGEDRPASGYPAAVGIVEAKTIAGGAIGISAGVLLDGNVTGTVRSDRIEPGGRAIGAKIDTIGRS